jgi:HEAT repeat protein
MKKTWAYVSATVLGAAVISQSAVASVAMDILQLPPQNRRMALMDLPADQFKKISEIAFSDSQPMRVRWAAVISLGEVNSSQSLPLLLKASQDKTWYMRNAALVALEENHPARAEVVAKKLLKDKALVVRSAAVEVLKKFPTAENRDLLWAELEEKYNYHRGQSLWIRSQIVAQLAQKPQDHEMSIFAKLLKDKDQRVHLASIRGLEKLTGVRLGDEQTSLQKKLSLWQDYLKKEGIF